jgi:uncharacterized cupredoxin-like copper-binding protein
MHLSKIRAGTLCVITAAFALAWALPAIAHPAAAKATVVNVTAGKPSEFSFTLSSKSVKKGTVTFKVTNGGTVPHNFKVCASSKGGTAVACAGAGTATISPKASATLKVTFKTAGSYEYMCTVPGHAAAGMKGILKVS